MTIYSFVRLLVLIVLFGTALRSAWPRIRRPALRRIAILRTLAGVALLAAVFTLAREIDAGDLRSLSGGPRTLVAGMMLAAIIWSVLLLTSILRLRDDHDPLPTGTLHWIIPATAGVILLVWAGSALQAHFGFAHRRTELLAAGLTVIVLTVVRPAWFWSHPKAEFLRDRVGDRATILIYVAIGGAFCALSLLGGGQ